MKWTEMTGMCSLTKFDVSCHRVKSGAPSSSFCNYLAKVSPKCTEESLFIQYGIACACYCSIWWNELRWQECIASPNLMFLAIGWNQVLRLRAFAIILLKSLQNAPKRVSSSSMASHVLVFAAFVMKWTEMTGMYSFTKFDVSCHRVKEGAPSSSFCNYLAKVSPKCTEESLFIQYGVACPRFRSICDEMKWDDRNV